MVKFLSHVWIKIRTTKKSHETYKLVIGIYWWVCCYLSEWRRMGACIETRNHKNRNGGIECARTHTHTLLFNEFEKIAELWKDISTPFTIIHMPNSTFILLLAQLRFFALLFILLKCVVRLTEWSRMWKGLNPNRIMSRFGWAVTFSQFTPFCWAMKFKCV